jgi:hypothetical protein
MLSFAVLQSILCCVVLSTQVHLIRKKWFDMFLRAPRRAESDFDSCERHLEMVIPASREGGTCRFSPLSGMCR